jgi:hypothetical protein
MDIEFHYWMTAIIARRAGFTEQEAGIIAASSQFVDENDVSLRIIDPASGRVYVNFVSQTMNILQPKNELMRIYPIFHFIPGDPLAISARRRDGKMHLFNTTPDSFYANAILDAALQSPEDTRLYRIGIASHAYADTFAHQNFTGWHDHFNAMGLNPIPNIGHADAKHHPDWVGHRWTDNRLVESEVNNNHRFLSAAQRLFTRYGDDLKARGRYAAGQRPAWEPLQNDLVNAMDAVASGDRLYDLDKRLGRYRALAPWLGEFDETQWFKAAVRTRVVGLADSTGGLLSHLTIFKDQHFWREDVETAATHWFRFQSAVKAHERFALGLLSPLFAQIGADLKTA